jgi:phosphoglucosamine mutase
MASSFAAAGGNVTWAGVLPTPAVSHLLRARSWDAGVVISASHNPAHDNGIKVLDADGQKIADSRERRIEALIESSEPLVGANPAAADHTLRHDYVAFLRSTHRGTAPLTGMQVIVDAANGAASGLARELLESLGATIEAVASEPNGTNINQNCGATAPQRLAEKVATAGADAGLALDGDADRAILVDERGRIFDGDDILLAWARHLDRQQRLPHRRVVATVMSNYGLEREMRHEGLEMVRCPVGDRAVWETMQEQGSALGGEQSGHIICSHHGVSGDGLLTGTHVLAIAAEGGVPLSSLSAFQRLPQVLLNVPVAKKTPFDELPDVTRELEDATRHLEARGRVLLRYSGTEPLARVMIEGEDASEINQLAERLAASIKAELG